jgi:hypothetical protein
MGREFRGVDTMKERYFRIFEGGNVAFGVWVFGYEGVGVVVCCAYD